MKHSVRLLNLFFFFHYCMRLKGLEVLNVFIKCIVSADSHFNQA